MKVQDKKNGCHYGIYSIEENLLGHIMNHYCISNVTHLYLSDLVEEAGKHYAIMEETDNPLFDDDLCFAEYLHRKNILDCSIQDVYVSPLAAHEIYSGCFLKKQEASTFNHLECDDEFYYDDWD